MSTVKHSENIFEMTLVAKMLLDKGAIKIEDSRDLVIDIHNLAIEFEKLHEGNSWDTEDYLDTIEKFTEDKLIVKWGDEEYFEPFSVTNKFGKTYYVSIHHEHPYEGHESDPIVAFTWKPYPKKPGHMAYFVSTFMEIEDGVWLDGGDRDAVLDGELVKKVKEFIKKNI